MGDAWCCSWQDWYCRGVEEAELALGFATAEPPELHVYGLYVFGSDGVIDDFDGSGVASLDGGLGLRPTHFGERLAHGDHYFGTDEETCEFGFSGGGHGKLDDLCDGDHWTVEAGDGVIFGDHNVGTGAAESFADDEVACVSVGCNDHATVSVGDSVVGVVAT